MGIEYLDEKTTYLLLTCFSAAFFGLFVLGAVLFDDFIARNMRKIEGFLAQLRKLI